MLFCTKNADFTVISVNHVSYYPDLHRDNVAGPCRVLAATFSMSRPILKPNTQLQSTVPFSKYL